MPPWTNSDQQVKALEQLKERMTACSYGQPDEETQKWFLRDRKLDVNEAAQKLTDMLKWRQDFQADSITWDMVAKEAKTGKAYLHEHRDVNGQPVIVIRSSLHITGEFSLDDSKRLCVLTLEKALKQLPEGQDTVLGIFDLRGFKQKNGDLGFAAFFERYLLHILPQATRPGPVHGCAMDLPAQLEAVQASPGQVLWFGSLREPRRTARQLLYPQHCPRRLQTGLNKHTEHCLYAAQFCYRLFCL